MPVKWTARLPSRTRPWSLPNFEFFFMGSWNKKLITPSKCLAGLEIWGVILLKRAQKQ
jgi:hypothetical protein